MGVSGQAPAGRSRGACLDVAAPAARGWRSVEAGHGQIAEIQRSRMVSAALHALEEIGYAEVTVVQITRRARVSRRTFYEQFANREECLAAALEEVVGLVERDLEAADLASLAWRERIRRGLRAILAFLDREPVLARACVVQLSSGGPEMLARREAILARLAAVVDEGRAQSARRRGPTALTAEGVVGAAFAIVQSRLLRASAGERVVLSDLLGELTALIVLPYLGAAAAQRELQRPSPAAAPASDPTLASNMGDPLSGVPMRLTYRTARVLAGIGEHPGASNRQVADSAGISDQGQVSKLLGRLQRLGLLANQRSDGQLKGEPNAWRLTPKGELVAQSIRMSARSTPRAA